MKKKVFFIIFIIFSSLVLINCSVSCVDFSVSCIKFNNMYKNNEKIENQKMEMVNSDFNEMISCLIEHKIIPSDIDIYVDSIYMQNFENCKCSIIKQRTILGSREVEERNFLSGTIEYSIYICFVNLKVDAKYDYDFYNNIKTSEFYFILDDSDTSYFEKSEFELFSDFFTVINEYFDWNYDFVDMLYTNQNIEFTGENFDLNKYKANEMEFGVKYEVLSDIDLNNELSFVYRAFQENGKSDYRKIFSINVYEKMGD